MRHVCLLINKIKPHLTISAKGEKPCLSRNAFPNLLKDERTREGVSGIVHVRTGSQEFLAGM